MANDKKKLSKSAKLAAKILSESKLLANVKNINEQNNSQEVKNETLIPKSNIANKMRPEKKRG